MRLNVLVPLLLGAGLLGGLVGCAHGGSGSSAASSAPASAAATAAAGASNGAEASVGATVFATNCSSCHGATGAGLPGAFPPLAGNPVVVGNPATVAHIVKYGLTGKVVVKGNTFNGIMPAWHGQLSDAQIAQAITYIRASWGNQASAVTPAEVAAVKK